MESITKSSSLSNTPSPILFFDGHCHLCQSSVQFLLKRERNQRFYFSPLQSKLAEDILPDELPDSLIVYKNGEVLSKSDAVRAVLLECSYPWPLLRIFWIVPRPIRNWLYDGIAKRRYRWFGQSEACMIPEPGWQERFLE